MTDPRIIPLANHMLSSIQKDLVLLKDHQVLDDQTLQHILTLLPSQATAVSPSPATTKPPLPTRKSTPSSPKLTPIPAPRTTPSFPKLPVRRASEKPPPHAAATAPPSYTATAPWVEAIFDYSSEDPNTDLSFQKGDKIKVTEQVNHDWWRGTLNGKSGIFPQNHVQPLSEQKESSKMCSPPGPLQTYSYPPPPTMVTNSTSPSMAVAPGNSMAVEEQPEGNGKVQHMAKKFGSRMGEAAMFGFGATVGSEAAHAIF